MPCYSQNLTIALQNQPLYTNSRLSGFLTRSSDQSKSPQIKQIRRSFFFQFTSPCSTCVEMLATPTLRLFSACTWSTCEFTLHNNSQFSLKTLRKQAYFCQKLVFISCPIQMLLSCAKLYDIRRISG